MALSNDLISQFVKITNDSPTSRKETTVYGTIVMNENGSFVRLDGADYSKVDPDSVGSTFIPIRMPDTTEATAGNSTVQIQNGDRVTVLIKNHYAIVTGNLNANAVGVKDSTYTSAQTVITDVNNIKAYNLEVENRLTADRADIDEINAHLLEANYLKTSELEAESAKIKQAVIDELDADYITADELTAESANIKTAVMEEVETDYLKSEDADITYANIDFSNIGQAAMEYFYSSSGLIESVTVNDGSITGRLVGVTIKGDLIEANTLVADKLVILGDNGLYYKLNTNGMTTESEQTEYNSLNGSIITAKSITATQISVSDLVAFDATIGGFNITDTSIYSEVKDSEDNVTRGIYMDSDGQINFGDATNFIKYYLDEDGTYKLTISAESILYALNGKQYSITDLGHIGEYVHVGTYDDEPCIELGETDSDFKLVITNTRIMFMEGSETPAYINNQSLHITKAVIEEEIQQGDFVWKIRQNGNMGLVWKGGT